jgi:hypothetical protein
MASRKGLLRVGANSIRRCIAIIGREVPGARVSFKCDAEQRSLGRGCRADVGRHGAINPADRVRGRKLDMAH